MRIYDDFSNSPHVNFFEPIIRQLKGDHEFVLTCRPLADVVSLLRQKGLKFEVVGKHYGASKVKKPWASGSGYYSYDSFLAGRAIDVAISHRSFYSPAVARLLGIRSIYLNDNEHAQGNWISFLCAHRIIVPEFISMQSVRAQWGNPRKVIRYPGDQEGVYLPALSFGASQSPSPPCSDL